ncbi:hypothetical protein MMC22_000243 [Lobaria immixta]|nr:hypothetical protein [Lobaria immixta]
MQNENLGCLNEEQKTALQTLRRFSNDTIQWFLVYARSVESPWRNKQRTQLHPDLLSKEELDAICVLRHCPDVLMSAGVNPRDGSQNAGLSTSNSTDKITCWCTYCSPPRRFKTKDGWARHERETHEEHVYPCMLNGDNEFTEQGPVCAICKTKYPDKVHLNNHNIGSCIGNTLSAQGYKRRIDLVNHLKLQHEVSNGQGLAEDWKRAPNKQAWACGFCVNYFPHRMDRINHIHAEHYTQGADMHNWDPVKVIRGLLLQPRLWDRWSEHLLVRCSSASPELTWHTSVVESLQKRLEMGEESPDVLVAAAYDQSNLSPSVLGNGPMSFNADMDVDPTAFDAMPYQFPQTSISLPDFSYNYNGFDTSHEPGSSDMDMANYSIVDYSYLDAESTKRSNQMPKPPIYQTSRPSSQQRNDNVPLDDVKDDGEWLARAESFDEAYGDANAWMQNYVEEADGKSTTPYA